MFTAAALEAEGDLIRRALHGLHDLHGVGVVAHEDEVFALCFSTEDQKEGMDAFVNKRAKHFQGK